MDELSNLREAVRSHLGYLEAAEDRLREPNFGDVEGREVPANIIGQQRRNLRRAAERTGSLDSPRTVTIDKGAPVD